MFDSSIPCPSPRIHSGIRITTQCIKRIVTRHTHLLWHSRISSSLSIAAEHLLLRQPSRIILAPNIPIETGILAIITRESSFCQILPLRTTNIPSLTVYITRGSVRVRPSL